MSNLFHTFEVHTCQITQRQKRCGISATRNSCVKDNRLTKRGLLEHVAAWKKVKRTRIERPRTGRALVRVCCTYMEARVCELAARSCARGANCGSKWRRQSAMWSSSAFRRRPTRSINRCTCRRPEGCSGTVRVHRNSNNVILFLFHVFDRSYDFPSVVYSFLLGLGVETRIKLRPKSEYMCVEPNQDRSFRLFSKNTFICCITLFF